MCFIQRPSKYIETTHITFKNLIKSFNFSQIVSDPTHKNGHLLDVVLTNDCTSVSNMKVVNLDIGDHSLIRFDIPMHPEIIKPYKFIQLRDFRSIDHDDFLLDSYEQFCVSDVPTTLETAIDQYSISIQTLIDKHAPAKLKRIKNVSSCLWFDQEYLLLRRKRRKAERMYKKSTLLTYELAYCELRKQCIELAKQKKLKCIRSKIENSSRSQKTLFSTV